MNANILEDAILSRTWEMSKRRDMDLCMVKRRCAGTPDLEIGVTFDIFLVDLVRNFYIANYKF